MTEMPAPAIVAVSAAGLTLARALAAALPGARVHGFAPRTAPDDADVLFDAVAPALRALFTAGTPIVALSAAGIVVRALAPVLADKHREPPVVVVAEDGGAVVPLLGGHHGANALAATLAAHLGVTAAVTTAGDRRFGVAFEAPPPGWRLANPGDVKPVAAALLAGAPIALAHDHGCPTADWLAGAALPRADDPAAATLHLRVTTAADPGGPTALVYHPQVLAVGVGCARGTAPATLTALVTGTLAAAGLAPGAVGVVASLDLKADEPAVHAAAAALGVPARFFPAERLARETPRLATPSAVVERAVGCPGVAEGAALAAVGETGRLVVTKQRTAEATCAVAAAPAPLDPAALGRPRGRLAVIGTGPGTPDWRTAETVRLVAGSTDIVGLGLYLDLLADLTDGKTCHRYPIGAETERVDHALDLAAAGARVALVSSGDPGIYALAALVCQRLEERGRADDGRIDLTIAPGISAIQAAAARVGAPIGHDLCTVSLSDLLTPWPVIERRLTAAATADFVVALYNPASEGRTTQLGAALAILAAHRPPTTPVVIARKLGRPGEQVTVTTLAEVSPAAVDMLTLVLIGASTTRVIAHGDGRPIVYTPRGYRGGGGGETAR